MLDSGLSKTVIAEKIGVHNSTIYRETCRGNLNGQYDPDYAEEQYRSKMIEKGQATIFEENPDLAKYVANMILEKKLSPQKIIELLKKEKEYSEIPLSKETIYYNIERGKIPGVTKESLRITSSKIFNNGMICLPRWVMKELNLKDGDFLDLEITKDKKIIYKKTD